MIKEDIDNGDFDEDFNTEFIFTDTKDAKHQLKQLIDILQRKYLESSTVQADSFVKNKNFEKILLVNHVLFHLL